MAVAKRGGEQGAKGPGRGRPAGSARGGEAAPGAGETQRDESGARHRWTVVAILAIPVVVFAVFLTVGPLRDTLFGRAMPAGAHPTAGATAAQGQAPGGQAAQGGDRAHMGDAEILQMAERLAARLEREPGDVNGWRTLARTWYVLKRFQDAVKAYEKLAALGPIDDADVLADYADAHAMSQGQQLEGKPMELVRKALEKNPGQWKALSMSATYAFQRKDYTAAASQWERALQSLPPESEMAQAINASLAQARRSAAGAGK